MPLTDGDVATLARQAVDLLDESVDLDIVPEAGVDPYRFGGLSAWTVWPLADGRRSFGVHIDASMTPVQALAHLLDTMSNDIADTSRFWGRAFPSCPGHPHPATVEIDDPDDTDTYAAFAEEVVLTCPSSGEVVGRIRPDLPG